MLFPGLKLIIKFEQNNRNEKSKNMTTPYPETLFKTPKEQRQRIALTVANAFLITGTMISLTVLYIAISLKSWHMFALYGGNVLYLVLTYLGLKQIRQNNIIEEYF